MVLRETSSGHYLVTQPDHARLAGELARHWNHPRLAAIADKEFLDAVSIHDSGWEPLDRLPEFSDSGRPVSFLEWPLTSSVDAWRRSIASAHTVGDRAAYVISRHFCVLAQMALSRQIAAEDRQAVEAFVAEHEIRAMDGVLENWTRVLQVSDLLSLHLITAGKMSTSLLKNYGIEAQFEVERDCLHLSPLPFDSVLRLECPARFLPRDSRTSVACEPLLFTVSR